MCAETHTSAQCHQRVAVAHSSSHVSTGKNPALHTRIECERQGAHSLQAAAGIGSHLCMIGFGLIYLLLTSKENFRNQIR